jgi:hypothetical protein
MFGRWFDRPAFSRTWRSPGVSEAADVPSLVCMRYALLAPLVDHDRWGFFLLDLK